jgi:hypothetical protein
MRASDVLGLARLLPLGDISTVAPPYGAGDARVALSESLSLKGEYLYVGFPDVDANYEFADGSKSEDVSVFRSDAHLLRVGLNYGF